MAWCWALSATGRNARPGWWAYVAASERWICPWSQKPSRREVCLRGMATGPPLSCRDSDGLGKVMGIYGTSKFMFFFCEISLEIEVPERNHIYIYINHIFTIIITIYGYGSIPIDTFLVGWTSIYQLFWCSPGVQGFDTLPHIAMIWGTQLLGDIDHHYILITYLLAHQWSR